MKKDEVRDLDENELIILIISLSGYFQKHIIRTGDDSTSIYYFNTKNSVNCLLNISNKLISEYQMNLEELLK